jgi:hypothetical protein
MNVHNENGLEQQLAQLAFGSLVLSRFGNRIDPDFSLALCNNLVVDAFGEVDTRTDGDLRPKTTQAVSMFVPGGNSAGGTLPTNYADGRFRSPDHGKDRFVRVLRVVQLQGSKDARSPYEKIASFQLQDDAEKAKMVIRGPFMDPAAQAMQPVPSRFEGDLLELLRSYRVCFLHWLRNESMDKQSTSRARFSKLLQQLAGPEAPAGPADAVRAVYDAPLSDPKASQSSLEGRFLRWLAK